MCRSLLPEQLAPVNTGADELFDSASPAKDNGTITPVALAALPDAIISSVQIPSMPV